MASRTGSVDVFLKLHGARKFSKEVDVAATELEAMGAKGASAVARFAKSGEKLKKFGRSWTHNITLPMAALGVISGKMASEFDSQASLISTQAGGSAKEVGMLKGQVQDLAKESEFGPTELMKGLFFIESAGLRGAKAMKMLRANVKLATTGNSDLEHTVFGTVGAMNALGKEGKNFNRIAAVMNATVGHGHMRMEELVGSISTGLVGAAKSFGVSWGGMNSAIAFFTRMGEPAQQVATRLRMTITHLATNATTKGAEALESIGMSADKMGASIRKTGRIGPVIKELAEHLNAVSKTKANQVLTEAFGGGRYGTQIREATQRVGLLLRTEREIGKSGTTKELSRGYRERLEQPANKLKRAWSSVQVALINIGNTLLPVAVPGLERLASVAGHLTDAFTALPGPVQAATIGFLLLTGPVASGLGYFASGAGRALVLAMKLAGAAKDLQIFYSAMRAGQGLSTAGSMAFSGSGMAGALQTAKGFALSLGPALAAYGIGNIVTSALNGDWKEAGFEAGGAIAGGIAGFMIDGPLGAMIGAGVGSLGGELLSGLFGGKQTSPLVPNTAPLANEQAQNTQEEAADPAAWKKAAASQPAPLDPRRIPCTRRRRLRGRSLASGRLQQGTGAELDP
jgi:TP901 family phage tail tape measure protein